MKKKIIFVTKGLWIGGIETSLVNLLNHFNYEKYDVTLLVLFASLDMLDQVNSKCRVIIADREKAITFQQAYQYARLHHLTEDAKCLSFKHKMMMWTVPFIRWIENRLYIKYIKEHMKTECFDTCIVYTDVVAETAIRAINAKKILMYYHHGVMRHVYHDKIAYKKCEKIIAVSENQAEALRKFVPKYADKIITIHNLVDVVTIREKAKLEIEEVFDDKKYNIVTVGRISYEKGMDIAVKVCAKLVEEGFDNVCWWIVGDGPAMQEVKKMILETHLEKNVVTVGTKNNPYPYIRKADLYVQPSRFEGYPMTILEALVLGQPVVSTDNNGAREIIDNNVTGILCQMNDESICEEIKMFINEPGKYELLRENVFFLDYELMNKKSILRLEELL